MYRVHQIPGVLIRSIYRESGPTRTLGALFGIPILIGIATFAAGLQVHQPFLKTIITTMTLFVGFSMNVVVLMLRYADRSDSSGNLIVQVRNISVYLIAVGIVLLLFSLIGTVLIENNVSLPLHGIPSALYYAFIAHFFAVALLFPARVFSIIENIGGNGGESVQNGSSSNEPLPDTDEASTDFA